MSDFSSYQSTYGGTGDPSATDSSSRSSYVNTDDPLVTTGRKPKKTGYGFSQDPQGSDHVDAGPEQKAKSQVLKDFYKLSGPELRQLQEKLYAGGFYGSTKRSQIGWGVQGDDVTADAYNGALSRTANINQVDKDKTVDSVLDDAKSGVDQSDKTVVSGKVTNPDDIRAIVRSSARHILGHDTDEDTVNRIISGYQQLETQDAVSSSIASDSGGIVTSTPDADVFVEDQLRAMHPDEAGATDFSHYAGEFNNLLASSQPGIQFQGVGSNG